MYVLFYGDQVTKVRTDAHREANTRAGDSTIHVLAPELVRDGVLSDALGATSLFNGQETYVLDTMSEHDEAYEILVEALPHLASSENVFVIIEGDLGGKEEKQFVEHAARVVKHTQEKRKEFNAFALTDALLLRDKKTLWILLTQAWQNGRTSEELIGTLFWQLKMLRLALVTGSASEAGQKPFVYDKAKRALKKFTPEELFRITHELIMLYHEGHRGKRDIDRALEAWVLKL